MAMVTESIPVAVPIRMRRATASDFDRLYTLYMDSEVNPYLVFEAMPPEAFRPIFEAFLSTREFYVYEEGSTIVAALTVARGEMRMAHVATLGTIAVHFDAHGTGVGAAFLSQVLALLAKQGVRRVDLTVDIDNPGAIAFYESQGFHREGLLHGYVRRTGETEDVDNVMMATLLESPAS